MPVKQFFKELKKLIPYNNISINQDVMGWFIGEKDSLIKVSQLTFIQSLWSIN